MSLAPNTKLGPYEILAAIGAGGMGEVYRARDNKLGREIAIKVLPEEFTQHPQKLARFEREARLLAALNHPGIATLHGLEDFEGKPFLVMELVEGQTLADRISHGPIPVGEALEISRQIAEALEAAHEKGVIHRDLKPANIKVDPEGRVKVLDFGLAKAFAEEVPESELSASPTLSRDATRAGVILGTAAYMSPEQARGKAVDKRTDIFSFGMVLYEMLTGKRAFKGEDVSDLLASIMKLEPDWEALPADVPPSLVKLLRRCLTKDRKNRLRDIGDVRFEIQEMLAAPTGVATEEAPSVSAPNVRRLHLAWGLGVLVVGLATGFTVWGLIRSEPRPLTRFAVTLPTSDQFILTGGIALSPDGRNLVYVANRDGVQQLHRRSMEELEPIPISGTEGGVAPFFSPDGEWVGFRAEGVLKKVSLGGGPSVALCNIEGWGASWGQDDQIVLASNAGLMRVSEHGGTPELITTLEPGEVRHQFPEFLPGGKAVLFSVYSGTPGTAQIAVHSLETGRRQILESGNFMRYAPTGHIVFSRANSLWAVPFDSDRLAVTGEPTPVLAGVPPVNPAGLTNFALAGDGSLAYVPSSTLGSGKFVWVDRGGREKPVAAIPQEYREFTLSPDGTKIAVRIVGSIDEDLWIHDLPLDTWTRLTFDPASERFPLWTPDGERVAFGGGQGMFWKFADGTGDVEPIVETPSHQRPLAFSPDGSMLVFLDLTEGFDLGMVSLEGERASTPLLNTDASEHNATISPDGRWMAYQSNESGEAQVYVRPFPNVEGGRWQVSSDGGRWPVWAPDGRGLFYLRQDTEMVAVSVETGPTFTVGQRERLFGMEPYFVASTVRRVAISPDGQKFLLLKIGAGESEDTAAPPSIIVVQNWHEELKRLVPTN